MVKHIQTIRRLLPANCLSVFDHTVRLALNGLILLTMTLHIHLLKSLIISRAVSKQVFGSYNFYCEKTTINFFMLEKSEECNLMMNSVFSFHQTVF